MKRCRTTVMRRRRPTRQGAPTDPVRSTWRHRAAEVGSAVFCRPQTPMLLRWEPTRQRQHLPTPSLQVADRLKVGNSPLPWAPASKTSPPRSPVTTSQLCFCNCISIFTFFKFIFIFNFNCVKVYYVLCSARSRIGGILRLLLVIRMISILLRKRQVSLIS